MKKNIYYYIKPNQSLQSLLVIINDKQTERQTGGEERMYCNECINGCNWIKGMLVCTYDQSEITTFTFTKNGNGVCNSNFYFLLIIFSRRPSSRSSSSSSKNVFFKLFLRF